MSFKQYFGRVAPTLAMVVLAACGTPDLVNKPSPRLEQRIQQETIVEDCMPHKYAVLINAVAGEPKWEADLSLAYQTLLEQGFRRSDVYILEGDEVDGRVYETSFHPTDGAATKKNIKRVFSHLQKKVKSDDLLFVYTSDHGERKEKIIDGRKSVTWTLLLNYDRLDQTEFTSYVAGLQPVRGIFLFEQCYGGGFAEKIGHDWNVAIAAARPNEQSFSDFSDSFSHFFLLAFRDVKGSDSNQDGRVSIDEAVEYARQRHSYTIKGDQFPFIQSEIDPGTVFLSK